MAATEFDLSQWHWRAGKTTLLQILAGQYMVGKDAVRILNRPAFHDIQLTSSGDLSYLGQQWRRDVAFAGYNVPIQVPSQPASQPARTERGSLVSTLPRYGLDFVPACVLLQHVSQTAAPERAS